MDPNDLLVWVDIETTGLDAYKDVILQVGILATNASFEIVSTGPQVVVHHVNLPIMDDVVREMHEATGLLDAVQASATGMKDAEAILLAYVQSFGVEKQAIPMCGSSVHFDRKFLQWDMPSFEDWFFRRNIDVSSWKEVIKRRMPEQYEKLHELLIPRKTHVPHDDLMDSIEELRAYWNLLAG